RGFERDVQRCAFEPSRLLGDPDADHGDVGQHAHRGPPPATGRNTGSVRPRDSRHVTSTGLPISGHFPGSVPTIVVRRPQPSSSRSTIASGNGTSNSGPGALYTIDTL